MSILLVFFLASIWIASRHLLLSSTIDLNKIIGAICIYLLLGLNWSVWYLFINIANPDSFHGLTSTAIGAQLSEFMYYSFVTITTVGYGDITPAKPIARTVTYLEAIVGQFYVAVLVAWLVGMYLSDKGRHRQNPLYSDGRAPRQFPYPLSRLKESGPALVDPAIGEKWTHLLDYEDRQALSKSPACQQPDLMTCQYRFATSALPELSTDKKAWRS